ncbi:ABC transporter ATP-binding protein [Jannaschia sp. CCS1]|uniref:ABC transporter ATP-binding protein n=1 Tax=Jannaschia sp. (strain CCS1) TaxID=290400 RepID=UPI000053C1B3|nr:ABC transporter ATP-binding protein [Jannaschia sp. CCS1]ABD55992.1 ABC transporter related protein [Jannaschia sp. CCS1]
MTHIISIHALSKHFGAVIGVDDVTLDVPEGQFVTLLGPSGCGKSTLLRMIGGFEDPTTGTIRLDGQDVTHVAPNKRAVNMVFQDYALFPHMSVGKNVGYGLRVSGVARADTEQQAREALMLVGLEDKVDAMPGQLSGGQRQRVALARALVRRPKVLLLDEPLSALDANLREAMQVELRRLHQQIGLTFIMVTHDQDEALAMSDRVIVMRDGRVMQDASPEDLYANPASPYVAGFVGTTNFFSSKAKDGAVAYSGQTLRLPQDLANTSLTTFGFRPEKARLVPIGQAPTGQALTGIVEEVLFHGKAMRVLVMVEGNHVTVDTPMWSAQARAGLPSVGEEAAIEIAPDAIMAFTSEAAE